MTIAVIGAGPSGCAAAYHLSRQGRDVVLYERGPAPGGRCLTHRERGHCLDTGAAFITNFYPRFMALAAELGCDGAIQELHRVTGLKRGDRVGLLNISSPSSFLRFPLLGLKHKARMALWTARLTLQRRRYDIACPETLLDVDARSVAEHAIEAVGAEAYHTLVRPGIEPFWYFRCEDVSEGLAVGLTAHAAGARFFHLEGGIDQVCQRMAQHAELHTHTEVTALQRRGDQIEVHSRRDGDDAVRLFDAVVIAATATTARHLIEALPETWVSRAQREFLDSQRYVANIHAAFRTRRLKDIPAAGSVFPCGPGQHEVAAVAFHRFRDSDPDASEELFSVYLSDEVSRDVMTLSDEALYQKCLTLAHQLLSVIPLDAEPFHLVRRKEAIPVHAPGRYKLAHQFQIEQTERGGPIFFCGDYLATATLEGAVATGAVVSKAMA